MRLLFGMLLLFTFEMHAADALDKRLKAEQWDSYAPFTLLPHHSNYLMPVTYVDGIAPTIQRDDVTAPSDNVEAKFQLSLKTPLWSKIYDDNGYLFFAFTQQAYWQAYNSDISSPFRETNYEPELILLIPHYRNYEEAASRIIGVSLSHQSNGRAGQLSRSWNRLKFSWVTSIGNVFINFEPWYRFKEQRKDTPEDPEGDDNPDITEYMGWFELSAAYKQENATWRLMLRNNLRSDNKGAVRLSYSRPFNQHIRLYVELFNGYGESMIDYNRSVTRLGIGFELNDIL
ncbi:phospholipase A [Rheinheimera aquimaris]|jgi:phospholipase A1|uniref:phospholipase A n=1 Tax=Rheinheimera aquimaris TaxID=412437 RepID=UPI000E7FFF1A|nr:phospholipase A [Rheinheimera aquimaris]MCD1600541.1 phospholipase A [Rheinheimera aquimaris]HBN89208.1 phospholipase [Rheinheimera sp.]